MKDNLIFLNRRILNFNESENALPVSNKSIEELTEDPIEDLLNEFSDLLEDCIDEVQVFSSKSNLASITEKNDKINIFTFEKQINNIKLLQRQTKYLLREISIYNLD